MSDQRPVKLADDLERFRSRIEAIMAGPAWVCPRCHESFHFALDQEPRCYDCEARDEAIAQRLDALAVPARFAGLSIERDEVREWSRRVVAGAEREGILLSGGTGTHKTGNALAALVSIVKAGFNRTVTWDSIPRLAQGTNLDEQRQRMDELASAAVVLLDDLGAHVASSWIDSGLTMLLDARWRECRPTIITTNLHAQGGPKIDPALTIAAAFGQRAVSRLAGYRVVTFRGPDGRVPR